MKNRKLAFVLVAVFAFLSHGLLDKFAVMTYHRPDADFNDPVWVGYHIGVLVATILFFHWWWKDYKWGIFFAFLPDFDWVIVHGQNLLGIAYHAKNRVPGISRHFYDTGYIHSTLHYLYDTIWPFYYLNDLPDYRYEPITAVGEILLLILLYLFLRAIKRRNATKEPLI